MSKKKEDFNHLAAKWLKFLIKKDKENEATIAELRNELDEVKNKTELLGQSVLKLYEKKK